MTRHLSTHHSYWREKTPLDQRFDRITGTESADVAVLGGGITGLSTALELLHRGLSVIVCEALTIGAGTTGASTGHLDAHPEMGPKKLIKLLGQEAAVEYVYLRKQAIAAIEHRAAGRCDFVRIPGCYYSERVSDADTLQSEYESATKVGLDAIWNDTAPLPHVACGYQIPGFARVDSLAYVQHLATAVQDAGGRIFEQTLVTAPTEKESVSLAAGGGKVYFDHVICAVHCNFTDSMKLYLQTPAYQSYATVVRVRNPPPDLLLWDNSDPYYYIRRVRSDDESLVLVGGCDHRTGSGDPQQAARDLQQYVRERFEVTEVVSQWSSELFEPTDSLPMIGRVPGKSNVWIATGLSGVGLTLGTVAGWMIADQISGREVPLQRELSPERFSLSEVGQVALEQVPAAASYAHRVLPTSEVDVSALQPGQGTVGKVNGVHTAVCRDADGCVHRLSPVCTHMSGTVSWNAAAQTWDCPVHGGRYAADGQRIYGPPEAALDQVSEPS